MTNYYLYRRNPRVLYSRSILRSMPITGYVSCMLWKQVSSPQREVKNQKRMLRRGERFFLDSQYTDDEYIGAISFITPIRVVTYTKENDLCLRVIKKRKTIYMAFCICMQYKCLRIQFVSMWYFIKLNVFCKELNSREEIVPCTCYCSRCYSNIRVSPMQNEGVVCCYCSGRDDGFGENGGDIECFTMLHMKQLNSKKTRFPRFDKILVI